jgi:hypothetical protein
LDTEHTAPMDRSMEPNRSTIVMPADIIIRGAVSRSRFLRLLVPRKLSWVRERATSRIMMAEKLKYFVMLSRSHALLPDTLGVFVFIARFLLTSSG